MASRRKNVLAFLFLVFIAFINSSHARRLLQNSATAISTSSGNSAQPSSSIAISRTDTKEESESISFVKSAIASAFAQACGGGNASAIAFSTSIAIGNATAQAYASSLSYVDVEGQGYADSKSSAQAIAVATATASAISEAVASATSNNAVAVAATKSEQIQNVTATAIATASTEASSSGGSATAYVASRAISTAVAKAVASSLSEALATAQAGRASFCPPVSSPSHANVPNSAPNNIDFGASNSTFVNNGGDSPSATGTESSGNDGEAPVTDSDPAHSSFPSAPPPISQSLRDTSNSTDQLPNSNSANGSTLEDVPLPSSPSNSISSSDSSPSTATSLPDSRGGILGSVLSILNGGLTGVGLGPSNDASSSTTLTQNNALDPMTFLPRFHGPAAL